MSLGICGRGRDAIILNTQLVDSTDPSDSPGQNGDKRSNKPAEHESSPEDRVTPAASDFQDDAPTPSSCVEASNQNCSPQLDEQESSRPQTEMPASEECQESDQSQSTAIFTSFATEEGLSDSSADVKYLNRPDPSDPGHSQQLSENSVPTAGGEEESDECTVGGESVETECNVIERNSHVTSSTTVSTTVSTTASDEQEDVLTTADVCSSQEEL